MSDSHAHGAHAAPDHHPHVLPVTTYFATFGVLLVLTGITVVASRFDFGSANLVIAILIATIKASIVGAMFMHLAFDHKFHSIIIASSLIFLAVFIAFTMFDTEYRGRSDVIEGERPADMQAPFKGSRAEAAMKAKYEWSESGQKVSAAASAATAMASAMAGLTPAASASASAAPSAAVPAPSASAAPAPSAAPVPSASH